MDLATFHANLLGRTEKTPPEFRLTADQERLYAAARSTPSQHGFLLASSKSLESWEHFLATFVLAYAQTPAGTVVLAVSPVTVRWVNEQVKKIARRIFHTRAASGPENIRQLYTGFQQLSMGSSVLQLSEPARWVAYGFHDRDLLAPWMRGRLLPLDGQ